MNKRQRKKQYKKIYGYNPLNKKKIVNKMGQAIENCIPKITEIIKDITNRISKTIKNIKEMPEDEFNQIIEKNDMTLEQIALARIIRGRKVESD